MKRNHLYCTNCDKVTKHTPKLSAIMDGSLVCTACSKMNGICTLLKVGDDSFYKTSRDARWVEWEDGRGKQMHEAPEVGYSLMMSPFNHFHTWLTTEITEIVEIKDGYVNFKTKNSEYKLFYNKNVKY